MRKLQFKEFNSNEELIKFVNDEKIVQDDIVSINSVAVTPNKLPSMVLTYHPFSFHLFYWKFEESQTQSFGDVTTFFTTNE
jgi:hypothetical protein